MIFDLINFNDLESKLRRCCNKNLVIRRDYLVIKYDDIDYHVTIFKDQWDDYYQKTGRPYYLFHISTNDPVNKCSTYLWVDILTHGITMVPPKYFKYEQSSFDFNGSTRKPCDINKILILIKRFQKILISI